MTPQEKAIELIAKIEMELVDIRVYIGTIKKLALIAVDECIKHEKQIVEQIKSLQLSNSFIAIINEGSFWEQVKHEINNI